MQEIGRKLMVVNGILLLIAGIFMIHHKRSLSREDSINNSPILSHMSTKLGDALQSNDKAKLSSSTEENRITGELLEVSVILKKSYFHIIVDNERVYNASGDRLKGVHVVTISGISGRTMSTRHFKTHAPAETKPFVHTLTTLTQAEIMVIIISPGATLFLAGAEEELIRRGCHLLTKLALGEAGAVIIVNNRVAVEGILTQAAPADITKRLTYLDVDKPVKNSLILNLQIKDVDIKRYECDWHSTPEMALQDHFCKNYDGFPELCRCQQPLTPHMLWNIAEHLNMNETIPCLIVTSGKRPELLYRMVLRLLQNRGGSQTPLFVYMNGKNQASESLLQLLNITYVFDADNKGNGTVTQLIARVMQRALKKGFDYFHLSSKMIILEEDIIISPDFLSYFHQTAWLLDSDPTIWAVSAHRSNSFPGQGLDPTTLLRGNFPTSWGWMGTRSVIKTWPPRNWEVRKGIAFALISLYIQPKK